MVKRSLSIPEWHRLAQAGETIPVRTLIHGNSMYPSVRMDRDYVTILPVRERVEAGDIVLFIDPYLDRFVLHRVWRVRGDQVLTWGDNCPRPDREMPLEAVCGLVTLIERGRLKIRPRRGRGLALARFWHVAGRGYRFGRRCVRSLRYRLGRLWKGRGR